CERKALALHPDIFTETEGTDGYLFTTTGIIILESEIAGDLNSRFNVFERWRFYTGDVTEIIIQNHKR
ncbi:MAG: hypothetical protein O4859_32120, partial [Trichodesmium sp. St18_bin1]|nr:hypothetical protein [Trichodesmium sp. St18_bin1]